MLRSRATLIAFALAPLGASGLAACLGEDVSSDPSGAAVDAAADAAPSAADGGSSEADGGQDAAAEASRPTCGGKSFSSPTAIGMPNGWPAEFYGARLDAVDWPTASVDAYFGSEAPGIPSEQHLFRARFSPQGLALTDPVRLTPTASGDQSVNWSPTVVASTLLFARGSLGARRLARMLPDGGSATALATAGVVAGTEASEAFFVPGRPTRVYYAFRGSINATSEIRAADLTADALGTPTAIAKAPGFGDRDYGAPVVSGDESILLFARAVTPGTNAFTSWEVVERVGTADVEHPELRSLGAPLAPSWLSSDGCHLIFIAGASRRMYHAQRSP